MIWSQRKLRSVRCVYTDQHDRTSGLEETQVRADDAENATEVQDNEMEHIGEQSKGTAEEKQPAVEESKADNEIPNNSADDTASSKKKRKDSGIANRFQRVKSDQTTFLDDRMRDMSYMAKPGAGDWGARANEDLIKTRGKNFTKEKNKKKRGSYKGGLIDQGSKCVHC